MLVRRAPLEFVQENSSFGDLNRGKRAGSRVVKLFALALLIFGILTAHAAFAQSLPLDFVPLPGANVLAANGGMDIAAEVVRDLNARVSIISLSKSQSVAARK
jgi:hypothetical protein